MADFIYDQKMGTGYVIGQDLITPFLQVGGLGGLVD